MDLDVMLGIIVVGGGLIAVLGPRLGRALGWLVLGGTLVASVGIFMKFSAGGSAELPGQIIMIIGALIALVVLVVGGAFAFGLLAGSRAIKAVTIDQVGQVARGLPPLVQDGAAVAAGGTAQAAAAVAGMLGARVTGAAHEVPLLKRGFVEGRRPDRFDLAVLAHAAGVDPGIAHLADRMNGETLLHWCVKLDLPDVAALLLDNGANPEASNGRGLRALAGASPVFMAKLQELRDAKV